MLPDPNQDYLEQTATTESDLTTVAPVLTDDVQGQVQALDPGLEGDLHDWFDPHPLVRRSESSARST